MHRYRDRNLKTQTVGLTMTCFPFLFSRKDGPTREYEDFSQELSNISGIKIYSYKELRAATNDFSASNKIGEGGFGAVYKGRLKDGTIGALKVLSAESRQGVKEFLTEIQVISDIKHDNLVKLYGCCVEGNHRILVYNYLENNSLQDTLLEGRNANLNFTWQIRKKICLGVAHGLAYLHEEVRPHIVHRDVKASNILLDKDLTPKISDFGLAKLIPSGASHVSTRVAGTIGYLAPEYAIRGQLTRKADIYSFGVLLMEIVFGRRNTNTKLPLEEQYILEMTWEMYEKKELLLLVDASLEGNFDAEEASRFLMIGLLCTQETASMRPNMSTVAKMLSGEKYVDEKKMNKPGLISDFLNIKKTVPKPDRDLMTSSSSTYVSSGSDNLTMSTGTSTVPTMTFSSLV